MKKIDSHQWICFGGGKSSGKTNDIAIRRVTIATKKVRNRPTLQKHKRFGAESFSRLGLEGQMVWKNKRFCQFLSPSSWPPQWDSRHRLLNQAIPMKKPEIHKRDCFGGDKSSGKTSDIAICAACTAAKTARILSTLQKHKRFCPNRLKKQYCNWCNGRESSGKTSDMELSQLRAALRIVH